MIRDRLCPHTGWGEARQQLKVFSFPPLYLLHPAPCLTQTPCRSLLLLPPPALKETLLGPTVCVTSWAGQSQWGMTASARVFTLVFMRLQQDFCVFKQSP